MLGLSTKKTYFSAALISLIYQILVTSLFQVLAGTSLERFFVLLGGDFKNGGVIQGFIIFASTWAFLEIKEKRRHVKKEFHGLCLSLLPTGERHVLLPMDLPNIEKKLNKLDKKYHDLLIRRVLFSAISKFKSTSSMAETIDIIAIQSEVNRELHESGQNNIRYLLWLIPSIGFMGTVLGISQSLTIADSGNMKEITSTLGIAFDTTLVSLILSAVVTGFFHRLQEETEKLHAHLKDYVISNFVNRLEIRRFTNPNMKIPPHSNKAS